MAVVVTQNIVRKNNSYFLLIFSVWMFGNNNMSNKKQIAWVDIENDSTVYYRNAIARGQDVDFDVFARAGEALTDLSLKPYDLIVLNVYTAAGVNYPEVEGGIDNPAVTCLDLVRRIRAFPANNDTSVVVVQISEGKAKVIGTDLENRLQRAGATRVVDLQPLSISEAYDTVFSQYLK